MHVKILEIVISTIGKIPNIKYIHNEWTRAHLHFNCDFIFIKNVLFV